MATSELSSNGRRHVCKGGCGTYTASPSEWFCWSDEAEGWLCQSCYANYFGNGRAAHMADDLGLGGRQNGHKPDRYADRVVDLAELLAQPEKPTPWRVEGVVADGTLTVISGESGDGKSWLAKALCQGVTHGESVLGLACTQGEALYVDGEMGRAMFARRLRAAAITKPIFRYVEALGLDFSMAADVAWLRVTIDGFNAKLIVIDSLRRLMPSQAENDSDNMAPAIAALAKLARDANVAIILIHHKGDGEKWYRGSTAIKDQSDALFGFLRDEEDPESPRRRLSCRGAKGKAPRYAPEPPDLWLAIDIPGGGVVEADPPDSLPPARAVRMMVKDGLKQAILEALPAKTKTEVAEALGRPLTDRWFQEAWRDLQRSGAIERGATGWVVLLPPPIGSASNTTPLDGAETALLSTVPVDPEEGE